MCSDHTAHLPASLRCLLSGVDQLLQASQLLLQHLFPVQGLLKNTANSKHGPSFKCSKYLQQTHTHKRLNVKVSLTTKDKNNCMCCFKMIYKLHQNLPLVEFMYPAFTRMPGESYYRQPRSLLCFCDSFRALINSGLIL